jgi:mono/diheme cytochrome c family protein
MMTLRSVSLLSALAVAAIGGCYTGSAVDTNRPPGASTDGTDPAEAGTKKKTQKTTGIPCDVSEVLITSCADCHGALLLGGAKSRLLTYEDLTAKSDTDPAQTIAELGLARMRSVAKPMPPDGNLSDDKIAPLDSWIKAGLPRGSCGEGPVSDSGPPGTDPDAADADPSPVCTSGAYFDPTTGKKGPQHEPGTLCVSCHRANNAAVLFAAGTVYPTIREPDECLGTTAANLAVVLIDSTGQSHNLPVNAAGNFYSKASFPGPLHAMVARGTDVREMTAPVTDGDCNSCHSEWGVSDTPGRIVPP